MPTATSGKDLAKFAQDHGLAFAERVDLPPQGATLTQSDGKVEGAATGQLPGGIEGSLVHFTYTYTWTDSDDHTHTETRRFTLVVIQIPESIGFLPYMGFSGSDSHLSQMAGSTEMTKIDLGKERGFDGAHACAYKGTSQSWAGPAPLPRPQRLARPQRGRLGLRTRQRRPLRRPRRLPDRGE